MNQASPSTAAHRFLLLDGLRGLAAFMVIVDHKPTPFLNDWLPGRALAVEFFFVLSGFVMAHAYGRRLEQGLSTFGLMKIRLIRLYPLFFIGLVLGIFTTAFPILRGWDPTPAVVLAAPAVTGLFMLPVPPMFAFNGRIFSFNSPSWSLFFELVANLVYGFVARFLSWRVFAVILPLLAAWVTWATFSRHPDIGPWNWDGFDQGFALVGYCFFAGVFIYRLFEAGRLPKLPAWLGPIVLLLAVMIPGKDPLVRQAVNALTTVVLMPLIVAGFARSEVKGVAAKVCATLGVLSYGVYILHVPIMRMVEWVLGTQVPGEVIVVVTGLTAAVVVIVLDRVFDRPVRRWLTERFTRPKSRLAAAE